MTQFIQSIAEFTAGTSLLVYVFIFVGKIVEVSLGTLSTVLINKGISVMAPDHDIRHDRI